MLVNVFLCVDSEGVVCGLVVVFEEEVLEGHRVLFLEGHDHMVAEAKEHQLRQDEVLMKRRQRLHLLFIHWSLYS